MKKGTATVKRALRPVLAALGLIVGASTLAVAQPAPPPPPPGWSGPHYYWHGRHFHHRRWIHDRHHGGSWRYY